MKADKKWPEVWPGWETVKLIGKGGYGRVYMVRRADSSGEYFCAVKKISIPTGEEEYYALSESGYEDQEISDIFKSRQNKIEAEFQMMEKFKGASHIVSYLEHMIVEQPHDNYNGIDILIRMELLQNLKERSKYLDESEVVHIGIDICEALELIENDGIIHRDIKPSNILYNDHLGYYKLSDFGIAKTIDHVTKGTVIGTLDYLAPEVFHEEAYGFLADQYSLGLVLYWALNNRKLPFIPLDHVPTDIELQAAKQDRMNGKPFPAPTNGSSRLQEIILKACAYDPEDRYKSITDLKKALLNLGNLDKNEETFSSDNDRVEAKEQEHIIDEIPLITNDDESTIGKFSESRKAGKKETANKNAGKKKTGRKKKETNIEPEVIPEETIPEPYPLPSINDFPYNDPYVQDFVKIWQMVSQADSLRQSGAEGDRERAESITNDALNMALGEYASWIANMYFAGSPLYFRELSLPQNDEEGRRWRERAIELGNVEQLYFCAYDYAYGSGGYSVDYEQALMLLNRAEQAIIARPGEYWFENEVRELKEKLEKELNRKPKSVQEAGDRKDNTSKKRTVRSILEEYLPLVLSSEAKGSGYAIAPRINNDNYQQVLDGMMDGSFLTNKNRTLYQSYLETIRKSIVENGEKVQGILFCRYSKLTIPPGIVLVFSDRAMYVREPIHGSWYADGNSCFSKSNDGWNRMDQKCQYQSFNQVSIINVPIWTGGYGHKAVECSLTERSFMTTSQLPTDRFIFLFNTKLFNEDKLVEMIRLLSKAE